MILQWPNILKIYSEILFCRCFPLQKVFFFPRSPITCSAVIFLLISFELLYVFIHSTAVVLPFVGISHYYLTYFVFRLQMYKYIAPFSFPSLNVRTRKFLPMLHRLCVMTLKAGYYLGQKFISKMTIILLIQSLMQK